MNHVKVSWDRIENLARRVAGRILAGGFAPQIIVPILRGGLVPARLVCNFFPAVSLCPIAAHLYDAPADRPGGRRPAVKVGAFPWRLARGACILVLDDIADSGRTLQAVCRQLRVADRAAVIQTATLLFRRTSRWQPDFYGAIIHHRRWFDFPWEIRTAPPRRARTQSGRHPCLKPLTV